jgi:ribosomal protein S18 acetylase RimI-like enzyme
MGGWTVAAARPEETGAALSLLFLSADRVELQERVDRTRQLLETGDLLREGLRVVRRGAEVLGAMLATTAPGSVGLVWPPQAQEMADRTAVEDALVQDTLAWLGGQHVKLCQALLRSEELPLARPLLRNGFSHITSLSYLRHGLESRPPASSDNSLHYEPYEAATQQAFAQILLRTYEGTLDCPELNGLRTVEEILAGHRAQGRFDPQHWWLVLEEAQPVGVLLINAATDERAWELIYMGLIPPARGRGLGRQILAKALHEAWQARVRKLTLSVDCRNLPALHLYQQAGFEVRDQREVFLAILTQAG